MIRALVLKEVRQHWMALLTLATLSLLGCALVVGLNLVQGMGGSVFEGLRIFALVLMPLSAVVLCHRLVVVEYQAKTQLFLEGLPVSRGRMVAVKYLLGLAVLALILGVALAATGATAWQREALTPRAAGFIATRVLSAAWCVYNFFFLMGFLGRYRWALYIAAVLAAVSIHEQTDVQFDRFGPLVLLDERLPYERDRLPWEALQATWALGGGCLLLAFGLGLTREGSVAALLAEKMSHREKVFLAALLVGLLSAVTVLSEKKRKAPFDLQEAVSAARPGVAVKVASNEPEDDPDARRLAEYVAEELEAAREYLGLQRLPPVFITRRSDVDAHRYERGELDEAEGVHVQANLEAAGWNREHFLAWLLRETLIVGSSGRLKQEPKLWLLDGFPLFWTRRPNAVAPLAQDRVPALRALYGLEGGLNVVSRRDLARWLSFREKVGEDIAAAVAWSGLRTLARRQGPERCQALLRSVLGTAVPQDIRALWSESSRPMDRLLREKAGVEFAEFLAAWQEELASARAELEADLAALPKVRGEVTFVPLSTESRQVRFRVQIDRPPAAEVRYALLYHALAPFDEEVSPSDLQREQRRYPREAEGDLPESYMRGARLYWTFTLDVPALGCPVISGWRREEIR
jgi:hypothetical protein